MALGVPVVATGAAARGLEARPDEHMLVEDDPARFAAAVVRLLSDADARGRLAARARSFVERQHAWPALLERVEMLVIDAGRATSGCLARRLRDRSAQGMEAPHP
jgi:glycosyltransferase involved in cell wall biosynthesis